MAETEHPRYGVLRAISDFDADKGFAPSLRELAQIVSTGMSTVHHHVSALQREGLVTWVPATARTLRITDDGRARIGNAKRK